MANSTNWTPATLTSTIYSNTVSKNGILMEDTVCLMEDSIYTLDDVTYNSVFPNSTTWINT